MCGSPPELPPNPDFIDLTHFELLKVVGKGGFGKVNAIQRRRTGELMALKRMSKCEVIKKESHIRMIWVERNIMAKLESPFLCTLEHSFQNDKELFFVMPFMQGGDLRFHLSKRGTMTERECRFYAAEMVLGLEEMHRKKIVYRDMKPDNLLLDSRGHLRLSDFGLSVELDEKNGYKIKGNAGTSGYLAPEVCAGEYYGTEPDVWSFGITVYELLHGRRPYRQWKADKDYIGRMKFHPDLSVHARSFIKGLLTVDPKQRLACGPSGWEEVKHHPFFRKIDWVKLANQELEPPIKPDTEHANCSNQADLADQLIDKKPEPIDPEYQKQFEGFEWNIDISKMDLRVKIRLGLVSDPNGIPPEHLNHNHTTTTNHERPSKQKPFNVLTSSAASASSSARPSFSVDPLTQKRHQHTSSLVSMGSMSESLPNNEYKVQSDNNNSHHPHIIPTPTSSHPNVKQPPNISPPSFDSTRRLEQKNVTVDMDPAMIIRQQQQHHMLRGGVYSESMNTESNMESMVAVHTERDSVSTSTVNSPVYIATQPSSPTQHIVPSIQQPPMMEQVQASA